MKIITAAEYEKLWEEGLKHDECFDDTNGFDEIGGSATEVRINCSEVRNTR